MKVDGPCASIFIYSPYTFLFIHFISFPLLSLWSELTLVLSIELFLEIADGYICRKAHVQHMEMSPMFVCVRSFDTPPSVTLSIGALPEIRKTEMVSIPSVWRLTSDVCRFSMASLVDGSILARFTKRMAVTRAGADW